MIITSNLQQQAWQFSQVMPEAVFDEADVNSDSVDDDSVKTVMSIALMVIGIIIFINI
jgi:hypothetical protein